MSHQRTIIDNPKVVSKAAESIWAMNKYYIMACSQNQYRQIQKLLRPSERDLPHAFAVLKQTEEAYSDMASNQLPELSNALFHIMGYFKNVLSTQQKQDLQSNILNHPEQAIQTLKKETFKYQIEYLLLCRLWNREQRFNQVPVPLRFSGYYYESDTFLWYGSYLQSK